ncbi:MAG: neuraminidase-like domain-containing protein [Blastocatellia bacterium]
MKLQGRSLEPNMRGEDVKLLQTELRRLRLKTQIVDPEGFFGSTTFLAVQEFQRNHGLEATGIVEEKTARLINQEVDEIGAERFMVRGEVREADGDPLRAVVVTVFRKGLRADELLGQATTAAMGDYSIEYRPAERPVNIFAQASDTTGKVIATSAVICKARPLEIVNLTPDGVFRGLSEFRQLRERLEPILRREQIRIEMLETGDVELLACAHELDAGHIGHLVASSRMAREAGMEAEAFYALVRQGLPTVLIALVSQSPEALRRAIEASVRENIVGAPIGRAIPKILSDLQRQIVRLALDEPTPDRPTFRALLDIAGVPAQRRQAIVTSYIERKGTVAEYWRQLRAQPGMSGEEVEAIQYTVGAAAIALNHTPMARELMRQRRAGRIGPNLRDLARFNRNDWEKLITSQTGGAAIGAPAVLGGKEEERPSRYADFLTRMVEALFPTPVLAHRLGEIDRERFAPTLAFLRRRPEFEFRAMRVDEFLRAHPDALDGAEDREAAVDQLRAVQRMMNIAPPFDKARTIALIADGIDSAVKVRRIGPAQFIRTRAKQLGGAAAAERVYTNAARQADTALMLLSQSKVFNPTMPGILAPHLFGEGVPDLQDLFGSLDLCQCEHCNSVYSPSAYLVDILHFLMNRPAATGNRTALDVLFGDPANASRRRRGDIGAIELTCHNANTVLPHVDLVNEILENAIAPGGGFPFQTEGDAAALAANPEHINAAAYDILGNAVYPWSLPFDLRVAESRRYLAELGVRRFTLMEHFNRENAAPARMDAAAECLGLTPRERAIITGGAPEATRQMWGMEAVEFNLLLAGRSAAVVLDRSGLSYEELVELLAVPFVDPGGTMRVRFAGADCNLATATITGLSTAGLDRMHRFSRLRRKLGWPAAELGMTLAALGATSLNDEALARLAEVKRLRETLKTPLETMLAWWSARLATQARDGQPSLYDRIFNDPTVNPPEVDIFRLNVARNELTDTSRSIGDHAAAVQAALGVSPDDLAVLRAEELPDDRLNLANLTRLYKAATLARVLRISIRHYAALRALTGVNPFTAAAGAEEFVRLARFVRESGFEPAALDYLLRHRVASPASLTNDQISELLDGLRAGLERIAADHAFSPDPAGARTAEKLALILPGEAVNRAVGLINGASIETEAGQTAFINDHFSMFLDPVEAAQRLVGPGRLATAEERFDYVLARLLAHLSRVAREGLVIETLAGALGLDSAITERLLRELVPSPADPGQAILSVFLAAEPPDQTVAFHRLAKIAMLLNALKVPSERVAFVIARGAGFGWLDLNALPLEERDSGAALFPRWSAMAALFRAAAGLPGGIPGMFDIFDDLDTPQISREEFLGRLAEHTEWSRDDIAFLTGPNGFDLEFRVDFADGQFFVRLKRCLELLAQLGAAAEEAWRWAGPTPDADVARAIRQAVRARFDDRRQWLIAAGPIRDELREQQRAALVAHLLHTLRIIIPVLETPRPTLALGARRRAVVELQLKLNASGAGLKMDGNFGPLTRAAVIAFQQANNLTADGIVGAATWARLDQARQRLSGPNDLYAHFLVDVEMAPCMLTSRIVLATNSVQLFVQRCLLNLEPEVELTPEDAREWEWMKNYRAWEANRKVFLYPENWIEPELRDDKTPFFTSLEHGLLQDEVNDSTVEREYLKYLQDLDRVAQLEISGLYRQWEVDRDILHVIGRTRNSPHLYYYRRWVDQRYWTPWERVEADIEGDHLVPVVWNRRLYLFWPLFLEKAEEEVGDEQAPRKYYDIRLAWSEYREGRWSPKRATDQSIQSPSRITPPGKARFSFWSYLTGDGLLAIASEMRDQGIFKLKQFLFVNCNGNLEAGIGGTFHALKPFPRTFGHFNALKESAQAPGEAGVLQPSTAPLAVLTGGRIRNDNGMIELIDPDEPQVLGHTPGTFVLTFPQNERPFVCLSPFFYQDDTRTFLIVPRGKYIGGFSGTIDDLTMEPDTTHLELPDIISLGAARSLASPGAAATPAPSASLPAHWEATHFRFQNFYHPYVCLLIEQLNRHGVEGILGPDPETEPPARRNLVGQLRRQRLDNGFFKVSFTGEYKPVEKVALMPGQFEEFDFSYGGAYSIYNWELFFHAPFLLARRLSGNQRFAEAHRWFHYIFDPTNVALSEPWPERVWRIKPFFEHGAGKSIEQAMLLLKSSGLSGREMEERRQLRDQIEAWRKTPFNPHLIARMRKEAYMKTVVMSYLDNLIAWGDHLFRQDTRESINEATQLYILAAEILGERPREIPAHEGTRKTINGREVRTFDQLRSHLDDFSNALVHLETIVYPMEADAGGGGIGGVTGATDFTLGSGQGGGGLAPDLPLAAPGVNPPDNGFVLDLPLATPVPAVLGPTLFFCIPKNDKLMGYWDTIGDRLFKIRHCMNIEGVARQLALFAPPIDPGLLVKAAAAGLDIGGVLGDLNAPLPHYRFQLLAQKANEFVNEVRSLGTALLSTLEKKDAEEMARLRSTHEVLVLEAIREVKQRQIDEAKGALEALEASKTVLEERRSFYESREQKSVKEQQHLDKLEEAQKFQIRSNAIEMARAAFGFLPDFDLGIEGVASSPTVKARWGGSNILSYMSAISQAFAMEAQRATYEAGKALTEAGYERRREDWDFQAEQARAELKQIDKQIAAAEIRAAIAERDLSNHELQIENAGTVDEFMRGKYTNQELYSWMAAQISAVYFQSYQLAFDAARRAERAYRYELGLENSNFIQFGYWDSLKKGLLSGERLAHDLRRMEAAHLDQNRREYEITRHLSLAMLDPLALIRLRETGQCFVDLPETLFDMDYPGHYLRRIKTVSLTIPCVTGPYTSINCTLTLLANSVRRAANPSSPYPRIVEGDDPRFADSVGAIQSIATSSAQNDSGMFELNFRDERYLPFEGAGAISRWRVELPLETNRFDRGTISDVVIHLRYTAREGGGGLRTAALDSLPLSGARLFSLRHEFPTEWHRFLHPAPGAATQPISLQRMDERFPFRRPGGAIRINGVTLLGRFTRNEAYTAALTPLLAGEAALNPDPGLGGLHLAFRGDLDVDLNDARDWTLRIDRGGNPLESDEVDDILLICAYIVVPPAP